MRIVASLILIAAMAILAWFFKDVWRPAQTPLVSTHTPNAPQIAANNTPAPVPDNSAAESAAGTTSNPQRTAASTKIERQAKKFVAKLTAPDPTPIRIEQADNFVTGDQLFSLIPDSASQETTVEKLIADQSRSPQAPITIVKHVEQVQRVSPEKLIASSAGNLDTPIQQLIHDKVVATTVRKILEQAGETPDTPIDIVKQVEYFEQTTAAELASELKSDAGLKAETIINVIKKSHGLEAASMDQLIRTQTPATPAKANSDTTPAQAKAPEQNLFYVRTVRPEDSQGIWGIVQDGIIKNFARGMAVRRGKQVNTYQVNIPRDSDEKLNGNTSSFLGRLIYRKTNESYVFNYRQNRMGRNPDKIRPGQEIVIINFHPEELIEIYRHFVDQRG